ncbi:MAG: ABC transporter substrate-binding protein, partial [candidate division Zixibacteria bacterium]|nr:ABC transporter substrate-binding protein [candidate division Zixibacteria bacterium]
ARIIGELVHSRTHAAIGPLTSEEAAVSSAALTCGNLPLIIPAATQAGLTALSSTSFQLSPNIELEGVLMAEYARNRMNFDSAAIITSTRSEHLRMARAFSERFRQLGGELIAIEYYRPRDKDFGPYIRDVKAIILGEEPDSVYFINQDGDTLDFDVVPAHVDCLFLPGSPAQLKLVLPQINFYNLSAFFLGTDGWGDRDVYSLGDDITQRAVFPSPFLAGATGDDYLTFAAAYDARYGHPPQRLANLGFDAVKLAAAAVADGGVTRESFVEKLTKITRHEGASGTISFGSHRENVVMPLYLIEDGQPVLWKNADTTSILEKAPGD